MSKTYTLSAETLRGTCKVRTTASKRYHVAVLGRGADRLKVTKRTNSIAAAEAEVRSQFQEGNPVVWVFEHGRLVSTYRYRVPTWSRW